MIVTQSTTPLVFSSATGLPSLKYTGSPIPPTLLVDNFSADSADTALLALAMVFEPVTVTTCPLASRPNPEIT